MPDRKRYLSPSPSFLDGGGEMGRLIRNYNWSESELGAADEWPVSLKTIISLILHTKFPMFLWWGPNLLCFYNDAYRPSLGVNGKHPSILGMPAKEAWAEIWHFIEPRITDILSGKDSIYLEDELVPIFRNGTIEQVYWTFSYSQVPNDNGVAGGILVTCHETTKNVRLLQKLQHSERRFQHLISDATVGIIVLVGDNLNVEIVNHSYCKLVSRTVEELMGRHFFDVVPEAEANLRPIINTVTVTGDPVILYEQPSPAYPPDTEISGYLNVVYQPYRETGGSVTGVMILCQDVTGQVRAKRNVEMALEQVRLSKDAAQLGLFDMDLVKGTLEWDQRCRELFGISDHRSVTFENDFVYGLHPEDREKITAIISQIFTDPALNGNYDVEYRTVGFEDGRLRWVRAKGKVYFDNNFVPLRFIGSVLDITDQKANEQRKNDFIAMVSHEMKTPLTSITAYIQLLLREAEQTPDSVEASILKRANVQTKKITTIINGFLNLSRLDLGKLDLKRTRFKLANLIGEGIADLVTAAPHADVELLSCPDVEVYMDREKVESVITNLLANAVKYSPIEKKVTVRCDYQNGVITVHISDRGMGIKASDLPFIFDRFYRVDNDRTRDISGFGIGLYLSPEIVKLHGGKIWAESEYGVGSTFSFSIPVQED